MNLYTAKLLSPVRHRHDLKQDQLSWIPAKFYERVVSFRK